MHLNYNIYSETFSLKMVHNKKLLGVNVDKNLGWIAVLIIAALLATTDQCTYLYKLFTFILH